MKEQPNLFELQGDSTQIAYSTSSQIGVPQLSYRDQKRNLNFSGDEIRSLQTEFGSQISVILEQIPDLQTVTLTLLLPTVNLPKGTREKPIETIVVLTTERTSFGGPDLVEGQLQSYSTLMLQGTGRLVNF